MASSSTGSYKVAFSPDLTEFKGIGTKISTMVGGGVSKALSSASNGLGSISSGLSNLSGALDGISSKIKSGMAVSIGAVSAAVASYIPQAIQASDATDSFANTLKFAGLSSEQVTQMIAQSRKYADLTVYDLSDIQSISAQLAANGVSGAEQLAEAAGNLNAVAGGTKDTYRSVGLVITQTAGLGHLNTQNWLQLANAIPGASGKLQDALKSAGAYTGDFSEALQNGDISASEFDAAIQKLGSTSEAVSAATSTSTFSGAWGNLEATIVGGLSDALNKNKESLTGFINELNGPALQATKLFGDALNTVVGVLNGSINISTLVGNIWSNSINKINTSIQTLRGDSQGIFTNISQQITAFMQGSISFSDLINGIGNTLKSAFSMQDIGLIITAITAAIPIFQKVLSFASILTGSLGGLFRILKSVSSVVGVLARILGGGFGIFAKIIPMLSPVTLIIGAIAAAFAVFLTQTSQGQQILSQIYAIFNQIWVSLQPAIAQLMAAFTNIWNLLQPVIAQLMAALQNLWVALQPVMADIMNIVIAILPALTPILNVVIGIITQIANLIAPVLNVIIGLITKIVNVIAAIVPPIMNIITPIAVWLINYMMPVIKMFAQYISNAIGGIRQIIEGFAGFFVKLFKGDIIGAIGSLKNAFGGIGKIFMSQLGFVRNVGKYIVQGLWKGISNGWNWITGKLKEFVGNFMKYMKKLFGIHSPSKLMANEVGIWLPKGIGVGIDESSGELLYKAENLSNAISSAINPDVGFNINGSLSYMDYSGISARYGYGNNITINQEVNKADSLMDIYLQTKAAANGYFSRNIVPPREKTK